MTDYQFLHVPKWNIKNHPNYYFCSNNKLHNLKTRRQAKKRVKGYSVGYTIEGKFITLDKLKPLLINLDQPKLTDLEILIKQLNKTL